MANQNVGVAPPDTSTKVGQFRLASGDNVWTPLDPPEAGLGQYALWSDDEIEVFLDLAGGSVARAIAIAYRQLAASWNSSSATIRTDDLQYSVKDSVGSWLSLADYWDQVADQEEERAIDNYFDLVSLRGGDRVCTPEGAPHRRDSDWWF